MVRLAFRPPLASSPSSSAKKGKQRPHQEEQRYGGDADSTSTSTTNAGPGNGRANASTRAGASAAKPRAAREKRSTAMEAPDDDALSLEGADTSASAEEVEDYDLGFLDDMACGVYKPISKLWGVQAIAGMIGEQCTSTNRSADETNEEEDDNGANQKAAKAKQGQAVVNSSLLEDSGSVDCGQHHSRRSITSSSFSEVSGEMETTTSISTSINNTTTSNTSIDIDIDVSADLDEIAQRQADVLFNELARTRQEVLLQKQRSMKKSSKGGRFKKGLHALSLRKSKNNHHSNSNDKSKTKTKTKSTSTSTTKLNASADRPVLAVVNDSGVDLVNVSLQRNDDTSNNNDANTSTSSTNSSKEEGTSTCSHNDESAKAVDTSGRTTNTGSSATYTYSATLRPEGMDSSIDLVVRTGPATGKTAATATAATATATAATATATAASSAVNDADVTTTTTNTIGTTATAAQAKLDALATATDDALASVFGLASMAQQREAKAKTMANAIMANAMANAKATATAKSKAESRTTGEAPEAEQSLLACGLEVQMAPSYDGRIVGSTVYFDEDVDDGDTFVSATSYSTYGDRRGGRRRACGGGRPRGGAVDNKGTTGIDSDLGLGDTASFGGGEASTAPARTTAPVRPAAAAATSTTHAAKATSSSTTFTVEDPTFVLEMSSIDEMMASFSTDVKPEASQKQEKSTVSQKGQRKPAQTTDDIVEDEPPLERSEFVTPVFNLLVRAYGAENFSGDDRWERVNFILDSYKGREDRLIQSLLTKAAEREAKQKKEPKEQVGTGNKKAGVETNAGTPSDSFQLDVSSIAPEAAPTSSSSTSEAPQKPDLSFRDLATRPVGDGDDDSLFGDLEEDDVEAVDNAGPSSRSPSKTVNAFGNYAIAPPPNKSAHASRRVYSPQGKALAPTSATPSTVGVNSDSDCSPAHNTSIQSNGSSSAAFDFGNFASSNPFSKRLDFIDHADDTNGHSGSIPRASSPFNSDIDGENNQFGYTHEHAAGSQKSGGFTAMVDSEDEQSSPAKPMRPPTQRRAGRASTRLRSILQGGAASAKTESASLLHS